MRPEWKDAPEWAEWLSCDPSGCWRWHFNRPTLEWISDEWLPAGTTPPPRPEEMLEGRPREQG